MLHATYSTKATKHTKLVLYVLFFLSLEKLLCPLLSWESANKSLQSILDDMDDY